MKIWVHALPHGELRKGKFEISDKEMPAIHNSIASWVEQNPTGIPVIIGHDDRDEAPEYGYADATKTDDHGLWLRLNLTDSEVAAAVTERKLHRVSVKLIKGFQDFRGKLWSAVLAHVGLVKNPMYHEQRPFEVALSQDSHESVHIEAQFSIEEPEMEKEYEEKVETEEVEAEMDPVLAEAMTRVAALEERLAALEERLAEPAAEPEVEAEVETEEEDEEKVEMSARIEVLRGLRGVNLGGWSEDELVELKLRAPKAYGKVISGLGKAAPGKTAPASRALGSTTSTVTLTAEEAFDKAKAEFERGGSFASTFRRLTGGE